MGNNNYYKKEKGFTLVEILVVVLIVGILASIAVPGYQRAVLKAEFSKLQVMAKALADAETTYQLANGAYVTNLEALDLSLPGRIISSTAIQIDNQRKCGLWQNEAKTAFVTSCTFKSRIQYVRSVASGNGECRAKKTDSVAMAVCEGFGGKKGGLYDGWQVYKIP